jgi:hypothetical protein
MWSQGDTFNVVQQLKRKQWFQMKAIARRRMEEKYRAVKRVFAHKVKLGPAIGRGKPLATPLFNRH